MSQQCAGNISIPALLLWTHLPLFFFLHSSWLRLPPVLWRASGVLLSRSKKKQSELSSHFPNKTNQLHAEQVIFGLQPKYPLEPHGNPLALLKCVVRDVAVIAGRATGRLYLWLSWFPLKAKIEKGVAHITARSKAVHVFLSHSGFPVFAVFLTWFVANCKQGFISWMLFFFMLL